MIDVEGTLRQLRAIDKIIDGVRDGKIGKLTTKEKNDLVRLYKAMRKSSKSLEWVLPYKAVLED